MGFWFENFSPEIDYEQSYLWYSVSVSGGIYKAMKLRDRVGEEIEAEKIVGYRLKLRKFLLKINILMKEKKRKGTYEI